MTRKDTILIAVVINAGLLAILFTTAVIYDTDKENEQIEFVTPIVDNKNPLADSPSSLIATISGDEVDDVLKYYQPSISQPLVGQSQSDVYVLEPTRTSNLENAEESSEFPSSQERFIEVTIKKGDMLEKIARANKTTVGVIKQVNHLENEQLAIGQVLKIPLKQNASYASVKPILENQTELKLDSQKLIKESEPVYYVIKSGDNPWKIAKYFGVKYDEILRLNHLDEDKARNLKIGDRVRVK